MKIPNSKNPIKYWNVEFKKLDFKIETYAILFI